MRTTIWGVGTELKETVATRVNHVLKKQTNFRTCYYRVIIMMKILETPSQ
jgi:hypothetical protein